MQEVKKREGRSRRAVKTIDISAEQCIFCPSCNQTNIELVDESATIFICNLEEWLCKDCGKAFLVESRRFITYEEVSKDVRPCRER